jgi:DMSO/TMAO reductase YedYZ molybdopterin-dependent catalytic subunit
MTDPSSILAASMVGVRLAIVQTQKRYGALAGVAAAAVALGVGELVALVVAPRSGPLVAVSGVVIDKVPESGKDLAISLFGTYDKFALQVGTIVLLLAFAAVVGILGQRRLWYGMAGIGLFGIVGLAAALTRSSATVLWAIPTLVATAAAAATLYYLLGRLGTVRRTGTEAARPEFDRRKFLQAAGMIVGVGAIAGYAGRALGEASSVNSARAAIRLPTPSGPPASTPPGSDMAGLSYVVSNGSFYRIDTAILLPQIDPNEWRLRIHGRVRKEIELTFNDLLSRPLIERYVTLSCVSNEVGGDLVGNAKWLGVPLKEILDEAGVDAGADQVVSRSDDGFSAGTPTAAIMDGRDAMIAIGMNGEPLPVAHGFPARLVVPGLYGYVSATKWVTDIELTTFADFDAYWVPRGWSQQAPIKTESRIDKPREGSKISPGQTVIAGVAWAPHRGISKVEVQVDDGPWQATTIGTVASVDTWRLWSLPWNAGAGDHQIRVRATDNAGDTQTSAEEPPAPNGATGWHTIRVSVG